MIIEHPRASILGEGKTITTGIRTMSIAHIVGKIVMIQITGIGDLGIAKLQATSGDRNLQDHEVRAPQTEEEGGTLPNQIFLILT